MKAQALFSLDDYTIMMYHAIMELILWKRGNQRMTLKNIIQGEIKMQTEAKVYRNPETGEELFRDVRKIRYEYKGTEFFVDMPGWYPKDNDNGIFTQEDMKVYDKALHLAKAEAEHLLTPNEIRKIRKKLALTQEAAGDLLGGGHRAFQKYESGEVLPSRAISNLLKILWKEPAMLDVLKE